jgi:hypothetical protein
LQIDYLVSVGLRQDEVCNMASISVVLLGLNPETRVKPVVEYLISRGVPGAWLGLGVKHTGREGGGGSSGRGWERVCCSSTTTSPQQLSGTELGAAQWGSRVGRRGR